MQGRENHGKTRDELMYWKSLNPSFKVVLLSNFRSTLGIPLYFSENVKGKLPSKVALKGPGVDLDTWEVQVKTSNDTTWFVGEGWKQFVAAFSLKENDTLVFKYKNNSYFKVTVFDGNTSCEKESSHFVIKSVSEQAIKERYALALKTNSLKPEVKCEKADQSSLRKSTMAKIVTKGAFDNSDYGVKPASNQSTKRKDGGRPVSPRNVRVKTEPGMDSESSVHSSESSPLNSESSPRSKCSREQTTKEIRRARQRAEEIQSFRKNSFFVALSRTHVTGNMKLSIPKQWWNDVVKSKKDECMKIRIKGKSEYSQHLYYCHYEESKCSATITTGWKKFVQENSLYEYDCCVFSLAKPLEENYQFIHMEVEIVRAILSTTKIEPS